ncbi:MAG TPA: PEGA domain-containing protein [Candidatus Saccharimonadales bacterium]|nr:PEGA domain-containing protein [Candidatus Saccharimonadales bacterium]
MDFLDPKKKRSRQIRLHIGHALMVLLVAVATYLLVSFAYGFKIDEKTGEVIQDGLLYIDSAPDGAQLSINGKYYDDTNTRVSLPEGDYTIDISKEGYRPWHHSLRLEGGEVERITYPALFPNVIDPTSIKDFDNKISLATQSPDRRWVIFARQNDLNSFIEYDLNEKVNDLPQSQELALGDSLFTKADGSHTLTLVEWSTDNKHFLLKHRWKSGSEFVMINRDKPEESFNLSRLLSKQPDKVTMIDKKFDKLFLYNSADKTLDKYNVADRELTRFANEILSFKPHGSDKVLLSRINQDNQKMAEVVLIEGNKEYIIRDVPAIKNIPLDIAQSDGDWYAAISEVKAKRTFIYKNPQQLFVESPNTENVLTIMLTNDAPIDDLSFSNNARFISSRSGQQFSVYDTEKNERFRYTIKDKFSEDTPPVWMDGHRIQAYSKSKIIVFEFDGANKQTLISADPSLPIFFDRDYTELYSFNTPEGENSSSLFLSQLRLEGDK